MAKKSIKLQRRAEREEQVKQKEYEDEQGIRRRIKSGYGKALSFGTLRKIKICLLISFPLAYFLYSVLLLPLVLLYSLTYYVTKKIERSLNFGLRKDLWISLPKFDAVLSMVLVVAVIAVVGLSAATDKTRSSAFAGKSETQIYVALVEQGMSESQAGTMARRMASSTMTMTKTQRILIQLGTMLTGQRELFQTKNAQLTMLGRGRFKPPGNMSENPPNMFTRPPSGSFGGNPPNFRNLNFSSIITSIFGTVDLILLIAIFGGGIYIFIKTRNEKYD